VVNGPEDPRPEPGLDAVDWDWVDWSGCEREVRRLRQRIFKATQEGDWPRVRSLQKLMVRHEARVFRTGVKDRRRLIVVAVG
jgi:RNA-directed DNA polymerase